MVNDNVLRTKKVKDLDYIKIDTDDETLKYFKGSDVADYEIDENDNLKLLSVHGKVYQFYKHRYVIVFKAREEL